MTSTRIGQDIGENKGSVTGAVSGDTDSRAQSVRIDLGDRSIADQQRILSDIMSIVFGDYREWDGVVREFRKLERSLTEKIASTEQRLESQIDSKINDFRAEVQETIRQISNRPQNQADRRLMISIMIGVCVLAAMMTWVVFILANGGIVL